MKTHSGWAALTVAAPIAWGTTYVTVTELFPPDRPLFVATTRVLPAGLVLLAVGAAISRRLDAARWRPHGAEWRRAATLALFNFGLFFPLLSVAVYRLPGGVAAAVGGLQPLLVAGLSRLVAGRRAGVLELVVGVVAAVGVALVVIRPGAQIDSVGVLAAVAANASFAMGVVLSKRFPVPANRIAWTGWQLVLSAVMLVPLTGAVEGVPSSLSGRALAGIANLSLIGTAVAFMLWFNGIRRLPVAAPPLLGLAAPVTGALLGWVVLGQDLSPLQLTGFAITLSAIAYGALLPPSAPAPSAAPSAPASSAPASSAPAPSAPAPRPSLSVGCARVSAWRAWHSPGSRSRMRSTTRAGGSCSARSAPACGSRRWSRHRASRRVLSPRPGAMPTST